MFSLYDFPKATPTDLQIRLDSDMAGRLIGRYGSTVSKLRRDYPHNEIKISDKRVGPRYVKISGGDLLPLYGEIISITSDKK